MNPPSSPGLPLAQNSDLGADGPHISRAQSEASAREDRMIPEGVREVREMLAEPPAATVCPPITSATVRVMRSHDYCHFEVVLSTDSKTLPSPMFVVDPNREPSHLTASQVVLREGGKLPEMTLSLGEVDALRKEAARLVDKAVAQFKIAKEAHAEREKMAQDYLFERASRTPADERSPEEKAIVKFHEDRAFRARFDYEYQDDWEPPDDGDDREDS